MESYNQLFEKRFRKSTEIDKTFVEKIDTEGLEAAIKYLISIGANELDMENYQIKFAISEFTKSDKNDNKKNEIITSLTNIKDYVISSNVKYSDKFKCNQICIETTDGIIEAIPISNYYKKIVDLFPEVETDARIGNCYEFAHYICLGLGESSKIVTGYIYGYTDKSKFLHSWVETVIDGKEYVIDGTINAIVNKEGYYLISKAQPMTEISYQTFKSDIKKYLVEIENIPREVYFVFRNEIINDLEKNSDFFKRK